MRTIELGVTITDAAVDGEVTVVFCDLLVDGPDRCPSCSQAGAYRDTVVRTVTDLPVAGHPLQLRVRVPRYRCESASCEREVFRHNTDRLARPGWSTTRRCARHILRQLMIDRTSIAAIARELGPSWDTVNAIATWATTTLITTDTSRLESVRVIGVDEHRWAHTRGAAGDGYVTVIVDLTPVFDGTVARSILVVVWHLLIDANARFCDLGADYHTRHIDTERKLRSHIAQLAALGYRVTVAPAA
nr:transposase family protein [Rhodococcus sp. 14C212]